MVHHALSCVNTKQKKSSYMLFRLPYTKYTRTHTHVTLPFDQNARLLHAHSTKTHFDDELGHMISQR